MQITVATEPTTGGSHAAQCYIICMIKVPIKNNHEDMYLLTDQLEAIQYILDLHIASTIISWFIFVCLLHVHCNLLTDTRMALSSCSKITNLCEPWNN